MKILSVLLGIALIVAGGVVIHLTREVGAERQQVARLKAQVEERDARIAALMAASMSSPGAPPAAPQLQAARPVAESVPPRANTQVDMATATQEFLARTQALTSSPEVAARLRLSRRVLIEQSNPDIGEALGLTPEEERRLLDLLVTHQERTNAVFRSAPDGASPEERGAALQAKQQENDAELQAMLGSKYSQWMDYTNETRQAWQQRRDLRAVLDASGTPMTDAQSKALVAALSAEHRAINQQLRESISQNGPLPERMRRYSPERRQQLLAAAAPHLGPQQLEGFRGMLERAAEQEQATLSMLQATEARAASPPAGASARP
jgi:hypothetical protein